MSHVQKAIDELQEKRNEAIEYTTENRKSLDVIPEADDLDQLERDCLLYTSPSPRDRG